MRSSSKKSTSAEVSAALGFTGVKTWQALRVSSNNNCSPCHPTCTFPGKTTYEPLEGKRAMPAPAATIRDVHIGTGAEIFHRLLPDLQGVTNELIFVTCFWAPSDSLQTFNAVLRHLAQKGRSQARPIRVSIYVSSVSVVQKLLHGPSKGRKGHVYATSEFHRTFGLLPHSEWVGGLELHVEAVFFLPFSVYHSKFMILDRRTVVLPSCNVSWERWLEVMVKFDGPLVQNFLRMFAETWQADLPNMSHEYDVDTSQTSDVTFPEIVIPQARELLLLHNRNPRFRPFPNQKTPAPPASPLNDKLLELFRTCKRELYIQTPNLTSPIVLEELRNTLRRGIDVHIVTCERMMVLEQIITAGTTTQRCVAEFVRGRRKDLQSGDRSVYDGAADAEVGRASSGLGHLLLQYYEPEFGHSNALITQDDEIPPVQSHVKLTIADGELVVLGSGNMDRASWYTSNELGVLFESRDLAKTLRDRLAIVLRDNLRTVFNG